MGIRLVVVWSILLALMPVASADEGRAAFFKRMAREDRHRAEEVRREAAEFNDSMLRYDGFGRVDLAHLYQAVEAEAQLWEKAAGLWDQEKEKEARQAREAADRAERVTEVWRRRLWEWRRRQAEAWPDERWYRDEVRWVRTGAIPEFNELVRARRAASDAWGRLAEATVPGADQANLFELREQAQAAEAEREMAEWRCNWARFREEVWQDKRIYSDDLKARLEALEKLQLERLEIRKSDVQRDRRLREIEEERRAAEQAFRRAYDQAREARQKAEERR